MLLPHSSQLATAESLFLLLTSSALIKIVDWTCWQERKYDGYIEVLFSSVRSAKDILKTFAVN
jgi:hypothetical protein